MYSRNLHGQSTVIFLFQYHIWTAIKSADIESSTRAHGGGGMAKLRDETMQRKSKKKEKRATLFLWFFRDLFEQGFVECLFQLCSNHKM